MHHKKHRIVWSGWALIFLLSALPLLRGPLWAQTSPPEVAIATADSVPIGGTIELPVEYRYSGGTVAVSGFDLYLAFDGSRSQLISVAPGDLLINCDWEYFTYRSAVDSGVPSDHLNGRVRVVALAETSNGDIHPSCLLDATGQLAVLTFAILDDPSLDGSFLPVRFLWVDCGDNVCSVATGDTLLVSSEVFEEGRIITVDSPLPGFTGASSACLTGSAGAVVRGVDFRHGGLHLALERTVSPSESSAGSVRILTPPYLQPGDTGYVSLVVDSLAPGFETGGFNFFLQYDSSVLSVLSVEQGQVLSDCGWELFSWHHGTTVDCNGSACTKATIHITSLADYFTPGHPLCWALSEGEVARLRIAVGDSAGVVPSAHPIEWVWYACNDNEWSSRNGDSVYTSRRVFDYDGLDLTADETYPTVAGAPAVCLTAPTIIRSIDYHHGLLDIVSDIPKLAFVPEVFTRDQADSPDPIPAVLYIGNLAGCTPGDIDPVTISIGGAAASSWEIVPPPAGFVGTVLEVDFDARGLIAPLFPSWGVDTVAVSITWAAGQVCPQGGTGMVILDGYELADINADGVVSITDLTVLVAWMFRGGSILGTEEAGDVNDSGSVNISDCVDLVQILFH